MIKKYLSVLAVASVYFVNAQDVSAIQNSVNVYSNPLLGGTTKFNSMAGSMGALGGDVSTIGVNPAGLGVFIASDVNTTLSIYNNKNTSSLAGRSVDYKTNNTDLGQAGGVAVFEVNGNSPWKFVNVGVNFVNTSLENYVETPGNANISYDLTDTDYVTLNGHAYDRYGDLSKMSIAVGGNYDNRIYVGAGIHVHSSSLTQYDTASMTHRSTTSGFNEYNELFSKQYTPYSEDASGFSANVGVIAKVNNQFRLGAALETPTWWSLDRVYDYYDINGNDGRYSETRKFRSPFKGTLSAAYVPNKSFALNVDYTLGLSKPKYSSDIAAVEQEFDNFYDNNYKNQSEIKVGAEYRINQFRVRAGYAHATNPFDTMTINAFDNNGGNGNVGFDNLYAGKRDTYSVGLGYDFGSFYIDGAYQNLKSSYSNPFLYGNNSAGSEYYSNTTYIFGDSSAVSEVENKRNLYTFTIGWRF